MNELSLFSGAGGGLLGTMLLGFHPIGYVEWDDYCQRVLAARIRDGILPDAPIFGDIKTFISDGYATSYSGLVDVVTGGFPCSDISCIKADGRGLDGEKSGHWKYMADCIGIIRPRFTFIENSPILTVRGLEQVLCDLASLGYDAKWLCLGGGHLYAPIKRDRLWILGIDNKWNGLGNKAHEKRTNIKKYFWSAELQSDLQDVETSWLISNGFGVREIDDVDSWVDRVSAIGNGQMPIVVAAAWRILTSNQ